MKTKKGEFFGNRIEASCEYCINSLSYDGSLSCRRGLSCLEKDCRKFQYDPLKREPVVQPPLPKFDPDTFKL